MVLSKHNFHPASEPVRRCSIDQNCTANHFAGRYAVCAITITLVSKAFSLVQCFKKWIRWLNPWGDVVLKRCSTANRKPFAGRHTVCDITITLVSKAFSLVQCFKKWIHWLSPWGDVALMRITSQTFCRQTCSVWYNCNTCVESVLSCIQCFKKWKRWLQEDKSLCFLGPISFYQQQFGQQRIELRSSFCVASAGWSDFTLF